MKRVVVLTALLGTALFSAPALASPFYPGVVEEVTGAAHSPMCIICHQTPQGGLGTATRPFAVYLRSRGLVAKDENALRNALAAAKGEKHDTDGDGVVDVDELAAGQNPNGDTVDAPPVEYGCGNVTGQEPGEIWVFAAVVVLLRARRKKRVNE